MAEAAHVQQVINEMESLWKVWETLLGNGLSAVVHVRWGRPNLGHTLFMKSPINHRLANDLQALTNYGLISVQHPRWDGGLHGVGRPSFFMHLREAEVK